MNARRNFFKSMLGLSAGAAVVSRPARADAGEAPVRVQPLDLRDLPFTVDNGVKVFHLIAEPVKQQITPDKTIDVWGYNGSAPGPTIQANQGDKLRVIFDNHLPEPTAIHWHGLELPIEVDGAPGVSQDPVRPGGRFVYEFTAHQEGTYFYHPHMAMQEMLGMLGAFILHPKAARAPRVDKDFVILLQEYAVLPSNTVPNTASMEFNWLVFNGKSGPAITPLILRLGDRVRIRLINMGMDHHPIHLHGFTFQVTGTEGGPIPPSNWYPGNTVLVGVAQARDFEFVANRPGDWMLHCHLPHHMMNQMASNVGPMTRLGSGMPAGGGMEEGMGMLRGSPGGPAGDDYGPTLGRGLGVGSTHDQAMTNNNMAMPADVSPNAASVPGFPQDAYMESPAMGMDAAVDKPENYGLRPGWSGYMQGMMTFVRVFPPDKYEEMTDRMRQARGMK